MIPHATHKRKTLHRRIPRHTLRFETLEARRVLDSTVVFSEIMYNPPGRNESLEWVELHNQMAVDMDLSGWSLRDAVEFEFPDGTIVPGDGRLVIAADPSELQESAGVEGALGPYAGRLSNAGERIQLFDNSGRNMNEVEYDDEGEWPVGPDGSGSTLALADSLIASHEVHNWRTSEQFGGTPGEANFPGDVRTQINTNWRFTQPLEGLDDQTPAWFDVDFDDVTWNEAASPFADIDYSALILDAEPLAYWPLDETEGPMAADLSGNGHDGRGDQAALFGQHSMITNPNSRALQVAGETGVTIPAFEKLPAGSTGLTHEYWMRIHELPASILYVISDADSNSDFFTRHQLMRDGKLRATFNFERRKTITSSTSFEVGETYHIVTTADLAQGLGKIYVNGQVDTTVELNTNGPRNTDNPFYLGKPPVDSAANVTLDEVAIYNRALDPTEISQHFKAGTISVLDTGPNTHYFRTEFPFQGDTELTQLEIDLRVDDGAIVYLNGLEVHRENMPDGPISFSTPATVPVDTAESTGPIVLGTSALRQGTNLIAVAVHQATPASEDVEFDFDIALTKLSISQFLPDVVINEVGVGRDGDFFVEILNHGDTPVPVGGLVIVDQDVDSRGEFVLPDQSLGAGEYLSFDSTTLGFTSTAGNRLFLYASDRPTLLDARVVGDRVQGRSSQHDERWLNVHVATPGAANVFALRDDVVINEIQYHDAPRLASSSRTTRLRPIAYSNRFDTWRFDATPNELDGQSSAWFDLNFDDSNWKQGTAPFGSADYVDSVMTSDPLAYWRLAESTGPTVLDASGNGHNGIAFTEVQFGQSSLLTSDSDNGALRLLKDERIVVPAFEKFPTDSTGFTLEYWVTLHDLPERGQEYTVSDNQGSSNYFFRNRITSTGALRSEFKLRGTRRVTSNTSLEIGRTYHVVSTMDVATDLASLYIDGQLEKTISLGRIETKHSGNPIFLGATEGGPGANMTLDEVAVYNRALSVDEISDHFLMGNLTNLASHSTTNYFRNNFQFDGDPTQTEMTLDILADDAAIVYLNGVEILRQNMPVGAIEPTTPAETPVDVATHSGPIPLESSALRKGENLLAVEVHQASPSGDDVRFDAELVLNETRGADVTYAESAEEWVELYNRGPAPISLNGWKLSDAIRFEFPENQILAPGEYLVIAKDAEALKADHPDIADRVIGNFSGRLSDDNERLLLLDEHDNPADEVHYFDKKPWPAFADGRNSSLELRDPDADNARAEAWSASDESAKSTWQSFTYQGLAINPPRSSNPSTFHEFVFGLLGAGEILIDDVQVIEEPSASALELIQDSGFDDTTASSWRLVGNHHGSVIDDDGNNVLHLVATGTAEHLQNHVETTLKNEESYRAIVPGREYRVSFRAKWLAGSRQLHSRLFFNFLPRTSLLQAPTSSGTPGRENSTRVSNLGPTYIDLNHFPVTPEADEPIRVSVDANDPDGVDELSLWYSVDGAPWERRTMTDDQGFFSADIPGQAVDAVVQFYVEGRDALGAISTFPAAGLDSRALIKVGAGPKSTTGLHNLRIIMTGDDEELIGRANNLMSNDRLGATVVYQDRVYYDVGVRLKGSEHGRPDVTRRSFSLRFHADDLFRGVQTTVGIDRSGGWRFGRQFGQDEILIYQFFNRAGGVPSQYNDLVFADAPTVSANTAILQLARYNDGFLDSRFENGSLGTLYEYELIYTMQARGSIEAVKTAQEGPSVFGVAVGANFSDDKEDYRQNFLIKNNRQRDDYQPLIRLSKAFSKSGDEFHEATRTAIDVDHWLRAFAALSLSGVADNYSTGVGHNALFYERPSDSRMILFPFDMDFAFFETPTSPLVRSPDLVKLLTEPNNEHHFLGHAHDILEQSYNLSYMSHWIEHYESRLVGQRLTAIGDYIQSRSDAVRKEFPDPVDFATTSSNPLNVDNASTATLMGRGWINVRNLRLAGSHQPLDVTWTSATDWQTTIPVDQSTSTVILEAYDFQDHLIATDTITIQSTANNPAVDALRITEINYHPHPPTAEELAQNPNLEDEDFEFIELTNISDQPLDLAGTQFVQIQDGQDTEGVEFSFSDGRISQLAPGECVLIVEDTAAFALRYGNQIPIAGQWVGGLSNRRETLTLISGAATVQQFAYQDNWYPETDGAGSSLVIVNPEADLPAWNQQEGWSLSGIHGGSPGRKTGRPGDVNGDGIFNSEDLVAVQQVGEFEDNIENNSTFAEGDWDGDGDFTTADLVFAFTFGGYQP